MGWNPANCWCLSSHFNTKLTKYRFPTRDQVLKANETRLARLTGDIRTFQAMDIGGKDQLFRPVNEYQARELLNKLVIAPEILQLKVFLIGQLSLVYTD